MKNLIWYLFFVQVLLFPFSIAFGKPSLEPIETVFSQDEGKLDNLVRILSPYAQNIREDLKQFGYCEINSKEKNWFEWREENRTCADSSKNPDDFRRYVVGRIENAVTEIMVNAKMIPELVEQVDSPKIKSESVRWIAIGTPGPMSDIDTVGILDDEIFTVVSSRGFLPKVVAETRAKILFDALGIAVFGRPLSVVFDTESYIDVTDDLRKDQYEKRIQNHDYQNLAFTLAFVQIARQLQRTIRVGDNFSYSFLDFKKSFGESAWSLQLTEASQFAERTTPKADPNENVRHYVDVINRLAELAAKTGDEISRAKIKGVLGTYFPEAYYTREALAHVCYSDDEFSQLMLTLVAEYFSRGEVDEVPLEKISEFKSKTISPNKFIFAVSALENLGYFFHKLDNQKNSFESLKNAGKYLFRVARALAGYWNLKKLEIEERSDDNKEQRFARSLYFMAQRFERLKRGHIPFSSPSEAVTLMEQVSTLLKKPLEQKNIIILANELYGLYIDPFLSPKLKQQRVDEVASRFDEVIRIEKGVYNLFEKGMSSEASADLMVVFGLVSGRNVEKKDRDKFQEKIKTKLEKSQLPHLDGNSTSTPLNDPKALGPFISDLVDLVRVTVEDYARAEKLTPANVGLTKIVQ